jgi:choline/glycine/proline betaine transport protein
MLTKIAVKEKKTGKFQYHIQPTTFWLSSAFILGFVLITIPLQSVLGSVFKTSFAWAMEYFGWLMVLTMNAVLFYCIYLIFSKFSDVRIGGADAKPEFSNAAWVAMLFSAGLGIGLLYYGVGEPMYHFISPPGDVEAGTPAAARTAMLYTFLHWGFHGWAIYALFGLSLAFATFNRGLPLSIRTVFYPLIGDRIYGPIGHFVDIFATACTLFGVATSLGLGCQQVNSGLNFLFGVPINGYVQILLIAIITGFACTSVVFGLEGGIKRVSVLNMWCAGALFAFVLLLGPTLFVVNFFLETTGDYLQNILHLSFWSETWSGGKWQNGWTVFYWAWWIAWGPFVGMFIGRISYGRTVREFVGGVLAVPVLITFLWISVFGGSALWLELFGSGGVAKAVQENFSSAFFVFLQQFPFSSITSTLSIFVIVIFFVTSSDSGSMVIDMITAGGHLEPPVPQRIYWSWMEGAVAAALLFGGGLVALQTAIVLAGVPFGLVVLFMIWSLQKGLSDYRAEMFPHIHEHPDIILEKLMSSRAKRRNKEAAAAKKAEG